MENNLRRQLIMLSKRLIFAFLVQLFLCTVILANTGNAQLKNIEEVKISMNLQEKSLAQFFKQVESKTDFKFTYTDNLIDLKQPVSVEENNTSLYDVLAMVSMQTNLRFVQVNENIHVKLLTGNKRNTVEVMELQEVTVSGKVIDENGDSLPGATITVFGTATGTITDIEGNYSITVPDGSVLIFSFIGYEPIRVPVDNRSQINITLKTDMSSLEEVVVVGYGEQRKVTFTGSVASVSGEAIRQTPVTNFSNSLVGRLPGLSSVTRSGEPGNDNSIIRIRGTNTLGNNGALVVVDGIPGRDLNRIDPNSIETITVLKDASAAIYGAQAANGVILITTKRGSSGKTKIEINMNQGFNRPTRIPKMANSEQYLTMLNEIEMYQGRPQRFSDEEIMNYREGSDPWRYPDTDWFNEVLKPWSSQTYNTLTVSGGNENFNHFLMLGAKSQDGYYENSATKYGQYDFRSNLDGKINENVRIGFDLAGRQENRNFPTRSAGNIFRAIMRGKPHIHAHVARHIHQILRIRGHWITKMLLQLHFSVLHQFKQISCGRFRIIE
ncbi:SusC/RagA family TonB-linked outer membrane protein [Algoriphagus antarcticus]|uniref:TonB-linked SusC/RagA family outer membrane protein n=1 Tax=Algoriphagus antarcticus TaxID=238540 RepID=A0A3E0DXU3_9BACT|nr:SusC/RagA family TonB-linked outer membrane protein [Algoriphagus antarcticus]REG88700.1 TonB-linked SusC/RagA family outer membrane protein [Algoriphagus antarcticus]